VKQEWTLLTLDNYLKETQSPAGLPFGTTFCRTLAETDKLPELTVGLGLIRLVGNNTSIDLVPPIKHAPKVLLNTFINEVAEQYLKLTEITDQWQELLLLELGYVKKLNHSGNNPMNNYVLFASIPQDEKLPLLEKYGFHKVATSVAYGHTENIDSVLTTLDELNADLPEEANYATIMNLLALGVPVEELHVAVQLPPEMAAEIYG
jgi:hypothetical protein